VRSARPEWLVPAVLAQAATYVAAALVWRQALRRAGHPRSLRTLVPLDYHRVLESVKKTRRALVVHAATEFCGFGGEIASTVSEELFSTLKAPVARLGADYAPIAYSREIETNQIPQAKSIAARLREVLAFKD